MTTNAAEIQRKVKQLENDINDIYDMLAGIRKQVSKQGAHLADFEAQMYERFDGLDGRIDKLEGRFDGMERRFDGMERRFDGLERRFEELGTSVGAKIDALTEAIRAR
jgi:archaellum component FlaC